MGLLARGASWLADVVADKEGVAVTYTRGGVGYPLTAFPAGVEAEVQQPTAPARFEFTHRAYRVRRADFAAIGLGDPAAGDRVTEVINGTAYTFVVRARGGADVAWEWADPGRTALTIHCKVR